MEVGGVHASQLVFVLLLLVVVAFGALARRLQAPYPIVLLVAGLLVSFVLGIPGTKLTSRPATSSTMGYGACSLRARAPNATTTRSSRTNTSCEAWTPPTSMVPLRRQQIGRSS